MRFLPLIAALGAGRWGAALFPVRGTWKRAGPWSTGVSIIIPERDSPDLLRAALTSAMAAAQALEEPWEVLVVVNGSTRSRYAALEVEFAAARWSFHHSPLAFAGAVTIGLSLANFGGIYLLNSDMTLDPEALTEVARWRLPHVFAIASQVFFADPGRRREETGWTDFAIEREEVRIFDAEPEDPETVRGALYAGGGASMFRRDLLERMIGGRDPYAPFYWEDVEWGVRAWWHGYEALFCPRSKATHRHRATVNRFYEPEEVDRIFRRNAVLFELRNDLTGRPLRRSLAVLRSLDAVSRRELSAWRVALSVLRALWQKREMPHSTIDLSRIRVKYHLNPPREGVKRVLIATPYHILPPGHGGARRIEGLLREVSSDYDFVLVSDEAGLYHPGDIKRCGDLFESVHLVGGRSAEPTGVDERIGRIESHSHARFAQELARIQTAYEPEFVQIEFIELAGLARAIAGDTPAILDLHDVLASGSPEGNAADRYESDLVNQFDAVLVCSREDAALVRHGDVTVVANGAAKPAKPNCSSSGRRSILFLGPFRYRPNLEGVLEFAERVFPKLRARFPGITLDVFSGHGGVDKARAFPALAQAGIRIHGHTDDAGAELERCALTINPLRGNRGSALKVAESVAAGRVCVSTIEGARGFLDADLPALIAVPTIDDFLEAISSLLEDEAYRLERERPSPEIEELLSWAGAGEALRSVYQRLSESSRPSARQSRGPESRRFRRAAKGGRGAQR
jgi:GT2 family glycosyltransferase